MGAVKIDKEIHSTTANAYARYDKGGWRYALLGVGKLGCCGNPLVI